MLISAAVATTTAVKNSVSFRKTLILRKERKGESRTIYPSNVHLRLSSFGLYRIIIGRLVIFLRFIITLSGPRRNPHLWNTNRKIVVLRKIFVLIVIGRAKMLYHVRQKLLFTNKEPISYSIVKIIKERSDD